MSFEDELRSVIQEGMTASTEFRRAWDEYRGSKIFPLFQRAETVLCEAFGSGGGGGRASLNNGSVVALFAARFRDREYSLTFHPDKEKREIVCSFDPVIAPDERFSLKDLSEEEIEAKVKTLARAVAEGKVADRREPAGMLVGKA